jgi:hypothetical protein
MPRLVRRKPLLDRVKDYLNPGDLWLWLSEWIETREWDGKRYAGPLALGLHFTLLIARANVEGSGSQGGDDVFGDDYSGTGWLSAIVGDLPASKPRDVTDTSIVLPLSCQCAVYLHSKTTLQTLREQY